MNNKSDYVWLVSFGDLLTLVLCFFVLVISLKSGQNRKPPEKNIAKLDTYKPDVHKTEESASKEQSGIGLALTNREMRSRSAEFLKRHSLQVSLFGDDVDSGTRRMRQNALERLQDAVFRAGYKDSKVRIRICRSENADDPATGNDGQGELLVNLRSQVIDTLESVAPDRISLATLSSRCLQKEALAMIEFEA